MSSTQYDVWDNDMQTCEGDIGNVRLDLDSAELWCEEGDPVEEKAALCIVQDRLKDIRQKIKQAEDAIEERKNAL